MKILASKVQVQEVENEGLISFLGKSITLFCGVWIYTGIVEGVNDFYVKLSDAKIVYETGELTAKAFKDAQKLPGEYWYVATQAIESFGPGK